MGCAAAWLSGAAGCSGVLEIAEGIACLLAGHCVLTSAVLVLHLTMVLPHTPCVPSWQVDHEPSVPTLETMLLSCLAFAAVHSLQVLMAGCLQLKRSHNLLLQGGAAVMAVIFELLVSLCCLWQCTCVYQQLCLRVRLCWVASLHRDIVFPFCHHCCVYFAVQERSTSASSGWCLLGVVLCVAGCCGSQITDIWQA